MHHRITAWLVVVVAALGAGAFAAAPAQANHPTQSYLDSSLRGQTAWAPDNDIKTYWDYVEEICHNANGGAIDIVSSTILYSSNPLAGAGIPHYRRATYSFLRSGGKTFERQFDGYWSSSSEYHDGPYSTYACPAP